MRRVPVSTLVLVALVSAVAAFALIRRFFGDLPPVGWTSVTFFAVAVVDLVLALRIRGAVSDGKVGQDRSQLHPLTVVRALALGQASALLGALASGVGAGLTLYMALHSAALEAAKEDLPGSIGVLVGGLVLAAAGVYLEHCCSLPPGEEDARGLAEPT